MFQLERKEKLLQYINEHKTASTQELCREFGMTPVTIRSDINDLAQSGLLIKIHGGAMSAQHRLNIEVPTSRKMQQHVEEKQRIAELAVKYIEPGDMIILDSGSTTLEIARRIKTPEVTVITNDILIAKTLIDVGNAMVYVTGGRNLNSVYALHGSETEEYLKKIRVNKLFLGCDAVNFEWGISNRTLEEVATKRAMINASREIFAVADSSKFGREVFAHLCALSEIDMLITEKMSREDIDRLTALGVKIDLPAAAQD